MSSIDAYYAQGKVVSASGEMLIFRPTGTNYELHLVPAGGAYGGPLNVVVAGLIRVRARKLWTVPSGGLWVVPITGTPRILQGRVRQIEGNQLVLRAGTDFIVELPQPDDALSLTEGAIALNSMVNIVVFPGASFEAAEVPAAAG